MGVEVREDVVGVDEVAVAVVPAEVEEGEVEANDRLVLHISSALSLYSNRYLHIYSESPTESSYFPYSSQRPRTR